MISWTSVLQYVEKYQDFVKIIAIETEWGKRTEFQASLGSVNCLPDMVQPSP